MEFKIMCGIIGILGKTDAVSRVVESLSRLEYRGYDSCGVAALVSKGIERRRAVGKIVQLQNLLSLEPLESPIAIGHTRWATHGGVSEKNAHPHGNENVVLVHNGIIENHNDLKKSLSLKGYVFETDTDTEVVVHLLDDLLKSMTPKAAVQALPKHLKGAYALVILFKSEPNMIYGIRQGSPLAVGYGNGEMYLGSDAIALSNLTQKITYLEDGDSAEINHDHVTVWDKLGAIVVREVKQSNFISGLIGKDGYRHFMLKEIYEQPRILGDIFAHYIDFENYTIKTTLDEKPSDINIVACGTSFYAGLVAKYWLEQTARIPVSVDIASEFRYRCPPLSKSGVSLFISQSGETIDTLEALKYAKEHQKVVGLVNVPESSIVRASHYHYPLLAGPEIGVASTKAFIAQLGVLSLFTLSLMDDNAKRKQLIDALIKAPGLINQVLNYEKQIESLAHKLTHASTILYLGRNLSYPIALEGALKLKELSYIHAEGFAAGEMKHGPIALIDQDTPVVVVAPHDEVYEKTLSNVQEVIARGAQVILLSSGDVDASLKEKLLGHIQLPEMDPFISPFVFAIPLQLLAYHVACLKGTDVDQPRNLAKSVTVE